MSYSPIDKPTDFFNSVIYTGNGSSPRSITGVGFQPDFNWTKSRSASGSHVLANSVSGANKQLVTNNSSAEATNGVYGYLSAFGSDGWTMTTGSSDFSRMNTNSATYVSWNWLAGTSFTNDASSTGIGTIDSTGSVSDTAGFSIVSYTGSGATATVGHGLSSAPAMIIIKSREDPASQPQHWIVYHQSLGNTSYQWLSRDIATGTSILGWNNTSPTSSVFSLGNGWTPNNYSGTNYIAYCFAEKKGFSKFGSYTGNGSTDGTFVYTGFKPAFVMGKATSGTENWFMNDNKRLGYNDKNYRLYPNLSNSEATDSNMEILSNGFKLNTANGNSNGVGKTYIYMAFAEEPLVGDNPATAR